MARSGAARRRFGSSLARLITTVFMGRGWFDRASILRHLALCLGAVLASVLRSQLLAGPEVLAIIAIALVFGATRHEDTSLILKHGWQTGRWITGFMGIIFAVLCVLDWLV